MISTKISSFFQGLSKPSNLQLRQLWTYVAVAFNKVDEHRLKLVGPDRMCAEWVLKNGGGVRFTQEPDRLFKDYNSLPSESTRLNIKEIDATDASIMKIGLEHLKSCKYIDKIILDRCKHLEDDGLEGLVHVKNTLKHLQVSACYNIDDKGLLVLRQLTLLKTLVMYSLPGVSNLDKVIEELRPFLKDCEISK